LMRSERCPGRSSCEFAPRTPNHYKEGFYSVSSDCVQFSGMRRLHAFGRDRILSALVEVVCERGYANASVTLVVARAKVSRRTFYEQFDGLDECFAAVIDLGLRVPGELIARAFAGEQDWRDGIRAALAALLEFFDAEPQLTQVWFGELLAVGGWALEHRERNIAVVQSAIVEHWSTATSQRADPVLAKGVMAAVFDALSSHIVTRREEPFITLLAPLTSLVVSPFLVPDAVKAQVEQAERLAAEILAERYPLSPGPRVWANAIEANDSPADLADGSSAAPNSLGRRRSTARVAVLGVELPAMLANPSARRARLCLLYLAEQDARGVSPSNHQVGKALGITHPSQTSKLLGRLAGIGLLDKRPGAPGHPNAWSLTEEGRRVAAALGKTRVADHG
jgi:AcrR family transcriptional regulator